MTEIKEIFIPQADFGYDVRYDVWAYLDAATNEVVAASVVDPEADTDGADIWRQCYVLPAYRRQGILRRFFASHQARSGRELRHPNSLTAESFALADYLGTAPALALADTKVVSPVGQSETLGKHLLARVTGTLQRGEHL
jgi:GNAT superfamily N-acetyltransferase